MGKKYATILRRLRRSTGKVYRRLRKKASKFRKRMINPSRKRAKKGSFSKAQISRLLKKHPVGRRATAKYRQFWKLSGPTQVKLFKDGTRKTNFLVSMGRSPNVLLADGPEGRHRKIKKLKKSRIVATDTSGKRIYILGKKFNGFKGKLRFAGYAPETHYIPTRAMEKAGTHKSGKYWVHKHGREEHGIWPKVYTDGTNFVYERGGNSKRSGKATYTITDWIRK